MHDVLDPRDLVPDEAEQLLHSGHPVAHLLAEARNAAAASDLVALGRIQATLDGVERDASWPYDEPDDDGTLLDLAAGMSELTTAGVRLDDRLLGAWTGRCVGNTMGKPVEGLTRDEVRTYLAAVGQWPQTGYVPVRDPLPTGVSHLHESAPYSGAGRFTEVPRDDDLDWTILALLMLEEHGTRLDTAAIARTWVDRLPFTQTFTAERAAYRNLVAGIPPERAALVDNPYREWIGALIRADMFGYVYPGRPGRAMRAVLADARLSHVGNGVYGELWAAALVSLAVVSESMPSALRLSLAAIPPRSRLAEAVRSLVELRAADADVSDAYEWIEAHLGHYNWVHTVNNAALIALGLLWGGDFVEAVAYAIAGGRDTDSTAATVGSVWGALHGSSAVPASLVGQTHTRVRSAVRDMDHVPVAELARRTLRLSERLA